MYWTPDGDSYEIKRVYEMTYNAHLKHKGEGVRFKVWAEEVKMYGTDDEDKHILKETYLYFEDNWFCGKGFVDERYGHAGKEFISVTLDVFPNGKYRIVCFKTKEARYIVEETISVEPRGSYNAGGVGICHRVEARKISDGNDENNENNENNDNDNHPDSNTNPDVNVLRQANLFFEVSKWFISTKSA
jgi:hypothetical protein